MKTVTAFHLHKKNSFDITVDGKQHTNTRLKIDCAACQMMNWYLKKILPDRLWQLGHWNSTFKRQNSCHVILAWVHKIYCKKLDVNYLQGVKIHEVNNGNLEINRYQSSTTKRMFTTTSVKKNDSKEMGATCKHACFLSPLQIPCLAMHQSIHCISQDVCPRWYCHFK